MQLTTTDTQRRSTSRDTWAAAVVIVVWLCATAWARPLSQPDEGRYVGVAWEMLRSGDWLTPTLDGLPFFHKPPLFYWITAASMKLFGPDQLAARAAPIAGAALAAFALYAFVRRWADVRLAWITVLALLVQPLFYLGGQFANLDMLVAGCITATILLLADAALCIEQRLPHRMALVAAYAVAALGVLAKGLIGLVIPALMIAAWLIWTRRWRLLRPLASSTGLVVFLLLAAPWFTLMQQRHAGFTYYFFIVQQFDRYTASGFNNVQPFWFYPGVLLVFSLPCVAWLYVSATRRSSTHGTLRALMWLWLAVVVVFFSLPRSKPLGYVLPAVPPLAFLIADGMLVLQTARARAAWQVSLVLAALLSVAAVVRYTLHPLHSARDLATALLAQRRPLEPVWMLDRYDYDVPFYARLGEPVGIVADWTVQQHDGWHTEFTDAMHFAPARAAGVLIAPADLPAALCRAPVAWVIGPAAASRRYPFLDLARVAYSGDGRVLWRLESKALAPVLHCNQPADQVATAP